MINSIPLTEEQVKALYEGLGTMNADDTELWLTVYVKTDDNHEVVGVPEYKLNCRRKND